MGKIAVLGAAFDPPTLGHKDVIEQCLECFDEVWLVPSFAHAFEKPMSAYSHRRALLQLFVDDLHVTRVIIQDVEPYIKEEGPVYSLSLMRYLEKHVAQKNQHLSLVLGEDNGKIFDKFYSYKVLQRDYSPFIAKDRVPVRSTLVRHAVKEGRQFEQMVSAQVAAYIRKLGLYR